MSATSAASFTSNFVPKWLVPLAASFAIGGVAPAQQANPPGGPTVNLNQPVAVTVTNPVQVQGAVAVVNDELRTPFVRSASASILQGGSATGIPAKLDIPAGKRLVIETIAVSARVSGLNGSKVRVTFSHVTKSGGVPGSISVTLPVDYTGNFVGNDWFAAVIPFKATIDSAAESDSELSFEMATNVTVTSASGATLFATVYGQLVDL